MKEAPKNSRLSDRVSRVGYSIVFNLRLILRNLTYRKLSISIIALGLIFSMTSLFSSTIWVNTSQKIIAEDYLATLDYEMYVSTYLTNAMGAVYEFVSSDSLVKQVDYEYTSVALFNFENKSPDYIWFPENQQENMSDPISFSHAIIVPSRAIERIKLNFEIEGNASLQKGEIMISYSQAKELEEIFHHQINPGDKITVAVSRRIPNTDIGETKLKYFDIKDTTFVNYTIAGIYKYIGKDSIVDMLFGGGVGAATIIDSILFPMDALSYEDLYTIDSNGLLPKLLVKTDPDRLSAEGITSMPDKILALQERIKTRFYHTYSRALSAQVQTMVDEYKRMFGSTSLLTPIIIIAILLTLVSTQMTIQRRKQEVSILRSRGAISFQIVMIFFGESLLIGAISWAISLGGSILVLGIIPSISQSKPISREVFSRFLSNIVISPYAIEMNSLMVLGIYFSITFAYVISFVTRDIQESLILTNKGRKFVLGTLLVTLFVFSVTSFIFLLVDYLKRARGRLFYEQDLI
ncbi:MAG: FtsX-like permease family protein, partial [Candidatus Heimdallarchaeaceae archaeon]